ncbi:CigA protein-like protein, partial [Phycomyces blakesleeanus]
MFARPMFFLTNTRKRLVLVILAMLGVCFVGFQLHYYRGDGLGLSDNLLRWSADESSPINAEEEQYLTYLPYSRFSNQRSTLLNAALLAKYLNRTLIVPPMILGSANGWSPAPGLYNVLEDMTDLKYQDRCFDNGEPVEEPIVLNDMGLPIFGCTNFTSYVMLPWSWATDLQRLTRSENDGGLGIKIIERSDMSLSRLQENLGLENKDMFVMQDSTRYQWHMYDTPGQAVNPRYQYEISLHELAGIRQRLVHFYGIFGYDRITLTDPLNEEYRLRIQHALIFQNKAITDSTTIILEQLLRDISASDEIVPLDPEQARTIERHGDFVPPQFVAAHIRAGDGVFLKGLGERVPEFVHQIWDIMTGNETILDDLIGSSNNKTANEQIAAHAHTLYPLPTAPVELRDRLLKLPLLERLAECGASKQMVLYVATDAIDPRNNYEMKPVLNAFPCTVFMADFSPEWKVPLLEVRSPLDPQKSLANHLIMFVDASVCAWAERFIGTRTSTFSNYIKQHRHAIYDEMIEHQHLH